MITPFRTDVSSFMLFKSYIDSADRVIKFLILDTTEEGDK